MASGDTNSMVLDQYSTQLCIYHALSPFTIPSILCIVLDIRSVLEITVGQFLTNFNIWPTKIHFGQPILLYIFNGMVINNLQNVPSSKKVADQFMTLIFTTVRCTTNV